MTREETLQNLADIFGVEVSVLTPETELDSLSWDSISKLTVMAFSNEYFGKRITAAEIRSFKVLGDLLKVLS
jgi:acyl carrier protein